MSDKNAFTGFTPQALSFLRDLKANNAKAWFEEHSSDYEQRLLSPLRRSNGGSIYNLI